jgi:hypothetical protein
MQAHSLRGRAAKSVSILTAVSTGGQKDRFGHGGMGPDLFCLGRALILLI